MPKSTRVVAVAGLALVGLAAFVGQSIGQDPAVRRTAADPDPATSKRPASVIGCIDINAVLKGYKKVDFLRQQMEAEAQLRKAELDKFMAQGQQTMQEMEKLAPTSDDFKAAESKVTELRAKIETGREQAQRDLAMKEAQALETVYKEIQQVVKGVATSNGLTYVIQISNDPISSEDPNSVVAAMMRTVVYSDRNAPDLTQMVVNYLNASYEKANPAAASAPAPADANTALAPSQPSPSASAPVGQPR